MVQNTTVEIRFFHSGYCTAHASVVDPEQGKGTSRFYAVWALLKHPAQGYILFDTGYAQRFYAATARFPEKLYALATPVCVQEDESATSQLKRLGILPSEIKTIILSHFHADHIAGVLDFPEANFICSKKAMEEVLTKNRIGALKKGILKALLPPDLKARTTYVEALSESVANTDTGLMFYDLYQDGSIKLVELPGHARGMLGIQVNTDTGQVLFAVDAAWNKDAFMRQTLPSKWTKLFFDSWKEYRSTFQKLFLYQKKNPNVRLLFTHCPHTMDYISAQHV